MTRFWKVIAGFIGGRSAVETQTEETIDEGEE